MSEEMESERERVLDPESEAFIAMDDEWVSPAPTTPLSGFSATPRRS